MAIPSTASTLISYEYVNPLNFCPLCGLRGLRGLRDFGDAPTPGRGAWRLLAALGGGGAWRLVVAPGA